MEERVSFPSPSRMKVAASAKLTPRMKHSDSLVSSLGKSSRGHGTAFGFCEKAKPYSLPTGYRRGQSASLRVSASSSAHMLYRTCPASPQVVGNRNTRTIRVGAITIERTTSPVWYHITSGALVLPFGLLFLRDAGPEEGGFAISVEELLLAGSK